MSNQHRNLLDHLEKKAQYHKGALAGLQTIIKLLKEQHNSSVDLGDLEDEDLEEDCDDDLYDEDEDEEEDDWDYEDLDDEDEEEVVDAIIKTKRTNKKSTKEGPQTPLVLSEKLPYQLSKLVRSGVVKNNSGVYELLQHPQKPSGSITSRVKELVETKFKDQQFSYRSVHEHCPDLTFIQVRNCLNRLIYKKFLTRVGTEVAIRSNGNEGLLKV